MAGQQAGWYPDPSGDASKLRYWDGMRWTDDCTSTQASQQTGTQSAPYSQPAGQYGAAQGYYGQPVQSATGDNDQTLRLVAFILCVLSTISVGWALIPLAWMIPMTVHCWGLYKGTKANTTAFGVCTLIFVNIVSGILLLVSKKDQ
ncbi:DUF2510 domain-containing protein [Raoultibacter phocaeensis]|uniref:DUF2510 domain-containing protein n=1 Tax=Raoultibacter phocaeensis TaxID=2479841 RepID=UPI0011192493|nr:DUF2510 domain-containing protein [Raoultibacter phocaeensis]